MNYNFLAVIILIVLLFAGVLVFKPYRYQPIPTGQKCCYFLDTWTGQPYNCVWSMEGSYKCSKLGNVGDVSKLPEHKFDMEAFMKNRKKQKLEKLKNMKK